MHHYAKARLPYLRYPHPVSVSLNLPRQGTSPAGAAIVSRGAARVDAAVAKSFATDADLRKRNADWHTVLVAMDGDNRRFAFQAAYHEAGHCVALYSYGLSIAEARLNWRLAADGPVMVSGHCERKAGAWDATPGPEIGLAGMEAEARQFGEAEDSDSDIEYATQVLPAGMTYDDAVASTQELISEQWAAVQAAAVVILRYGQAPGNELERAMRGAWVGRRVCREV